MFNRTIINTSLSFLAAIVLYNIFYRLNYFIKQNHLLIIVCGSAASWMLNKLINSRRSLHNRVTKRIKLETFTLRECELFLKSKNISLDRYQIIQLYMVLGGIPFYWEGIEAGKSAIQNINDICFLENGLLYHEFLNLFRSLFNDFQNHEKIILSIAKKSKGLSRKEIVEMAKLPSAGSTSRMLYASEHQEKIGVFKAETGTRKSVFLMMITTFGLKRNNYSDALVQNDLTMDEFFREV